MVLICIQFIKTFKDINSCQSYVKRAGLCLSLHSQLTQALLSSCSFGNQCFVLFFTSLPLILCHIWDVFAKYDSELEQESAVTWQHVKLSTETMYCFPQGKAITINCKSKERNMISWNAYGQTSKVFWILYMTNWARWGAPGAVFAMCFWWDWCIGGDLSESASLTHFITPSHATPPQGRGNQLLELWYKSKIAQRSTNCST